MTAVGTFHGTSLRGVDIGAVTSPAVRLSPYARNLVRDNRGIAASTVTVNVHVADCDAASTAVHFTDVEPIGKKAPDCLEQLTCTGSTPPLVHGAAKVTGMAAPVVDATRTLAGHVMLGGGTGVAGGFTGGPAVGGGAAGGVGDVGDEHAPAKNISIATKARLPARTARFLRTHRITVCGTNAESYYDTSALSTKAPIAPVHCMPTTAHSV